MARGATKTTPEQRRYILQLIHEQPDLSSREIARRAGAHVNAVTTLRHPRGQLRGNAGAPPTAVTPAAAAAPIEPPPSPLAVTLATVADNYQADESSTRPRSKRSEAAGDNSASSHELGDTFAIVLLIVTSLVATVQQDERLEMTDTEAEEIAKPLARIFARTDLNRRIGRKIAGSNDYLMLFVALSSYAERVAVVVVERRQAHAQSTQPGTSVAGPTGPGGNAAAQPQPQQPNVTNNGHLAPPIPGQGGFALPASPRRPGIF